MDKKILYYVFLMALPEYGIMYSNKEALGVTRVKKSLLIMFLSAAVILSGCGIENTVMDNTSKPEATTITESKTVEKNNDLKKETIESTSSHKNSGEEEKASKLEHIETIIDKYDEILSDEKYSLRIIDRIRKEQNFYEISIKNKPEISVNISYGDITELWFYEYPKTGIVEKSFSALFSEQTENNLIKEFIKVTLMVLDSNMDEDTAEEKLRQLVESTGSSARSCIIDVGEYRVYFEKDVSGDIISNGFTTVYAFHSSEVNKEVNKEEYKNYSVEEMKAPLNQGEKAYITVTPYSYSEIPEEFIAKNDDGEEYLIYYDYNSFLMDFELNKKYTMYGAIAKAYGDMPAFRVDYYEVSE